MCARNVHGGLTNPLINVNDWTLSEFKSIINERVLSTIKRFYFCGNFGDPILNNDLIDMCEYAVSVNLDIQIKIHTNGGARKKEWWAKLATVLPKDHLVIFAIDGLEDTHHLYRVGTTFENVIANASAFIDAGGRAEWAFIKFRHNEHQHDQARTLAKQLKFEKFTLKNSTRFIGEPTFAVFDKEGNTTHHLQPPTDNKVQFISKKVLEQYKDTVMTLDVKCKVLDSKEVYIDAHKDIYPCCWIGAVPYTYYDQVNVAPALTKQIREQFNELISELGNTNALDLSIESVINSTPWQTVWGKYWTTKKMITCARICGNSKEISRPEDQFVNREIFS
jgi:sulfatase maturation enzyme AslB (radical SAM superfamily)